MVDEAAVWAHVERALDHYGDGLVEAAEQELGHAVKLAPSDPRLSRMLDWIRRPADDAPLFSVAPLQTSDAPPRRPSAVQQLASFSGAVPFDDGKPQVTPAPPLAPMQPVASSPVEVQLSPNAMSEQLPEPPRTKLGQELDLTPPVRPGPGPEPPPRSPRRTSDRMAAVDEFRSTPSKNTKHPGTLLGVAGPSLLHQMLDDPAPTGAPVTTKSTPSHRSLPSLDQPPPRGASAPRLEAPGDDHDKNAPESEFAPQLSPPRGTQFLHKVSPEEITSVRRRSEVMRAASPPSAGRRTPSDKRTNPYLRHPTGEVSQAFSDLHMAVEASAALEAFELAERAMEMAHGDQLTEEHQRVLVRAYELAIGPLDQPVRHGSAPATLDPRTAFLLSRIDGMMSVDELLEISGMPRFEALRLLAQLVRQGVVEF